LRAWVLRLQYDHLRVLEVHDEEGQMLVSHQSWVHNGAVEHTTAQRLHKAHATSATTSNGDTEPNAHQSRSDLYTNAARRGT